MLRKPLTSYGWGFAWGGVIVFVGVALLLDHMGIVSIGGLWRFWPMILVLAGIVNILDECRRMWGVILLAAGILLQLGEFNLVRVTWALLWPVSASRSAKPSQVTQRSSAGRPRHPCLALVSRFRFPTLPWPMAALPTPWTTTTVV